MSKWIRRGDQVKVIAGNDKGKFGMVLGREDDRILVQGVNIRKKHLKRTEQSQGPRIVEMEVPVHVSNVCLCNNEGVPLKVRIRQEKQGSDREIISVSGDKETLYRPVKKPV